MSSAGVLPRHCLDQGLYSKHFDHSLQVVRQYMQAHFGADTWQRFGQEMSRFHPGFQGAEDMFDGSAANLHRVGSFGKTRQHSLQDTLVFPATDSSRDTCRALRLDGALRAG